MIKILYSVLLALFLANNVCLNAAEKKKLFIPEQDIKKHGLDKADGNFGYEYKAESENILCYGTSLSERILKQIH